MRRLRIVITSLAASVIGVVACSGGTYTNGGPGSGVAQDKRLADLSRAEEGQLCDFFAGKFGGYGISRAGTCTNDGSSHTSSPASQAKCIDSFLERIPDTCPMKVSEAEVCFTDLESSICKPFPQSCFLLTQPVCGPVFGVTTVVTEPPPIEAGTSDATVEEDASSKTCPGNTKQTAPFINATCQAALEKECCAELTACFGIVTTGGKDNCNAFSQCIPKCRFKLDGTPETDQAKISACEDDCVAASQTNVVDAYDAIATCATGHPASNAACQ
jgi:hypothetical protein